MRKFVFQLQPLLELRRRQEQTKQRALAEINRHRITLEAQLRRQQELIRQDKADLRQRLTGPLDTTALRMNASASLQSLRIAQRLAIELAGAHRRMNSARDELVEATKHRRAMELLRDRRFQQWSAEVEKADVTAMDELAVISAARKEHQ